ncbi:MAG: ABC transporter substrate-binding protein [Acidisphaera sp.]|nr:ABC transporter substrate-binding protein [Acidisphaera sp.]
MKTSRRSIVRAGLAAGAMAGLPRIARAQPATSARTLRAVMQADLRVFDPIWTTANITGYHGALIYDMLFGIDADFKPQPQMVGKYSLSDDKKLYTMELRDGLGWHDGTPVVAADCVASLRRWGSVDSGGQAMMERVSDISAKDEKTFVIALKEPFGLLLDELAKPVTRCCYMMRRKDAERPATEQVSANIGSGPFTFNQAEAKPGAQFVYDKNLRYVPRQEPPSGLAGGKMVKLDRVVWENIGDEQTAMAALQSGEIDFYETPPIDLIGQLESDPAIKVDVLNKTGNICILRMNWLHKPFSDVHARQALLYLVDQNAFMKASFGNPKYYRTVPSIFGNDTPMSNDENTDWFRHGVDLDRARDLFKQAGYAGEQVIVLQATNFAYMSNSEQLIAGQLKKIGVNAELAPSDWGGVVTRRANQGPDDKGGWDIFVTADSDYSHSDPIGVSSLSMAGMNSWYGWPSDDAYEALRRKWADADTLDERKAIARQMQGLAWNSVGTVLLGQWLAPAAYRTNVRGVIGIPEIIPFWNIEKS